LVTDGVKVGVGVIVDVGEFETVIVGVTVGV